jgi:hypothetical protein
LLLLSPIPSSGETGVKVNREGADIIGGRSIFAIACRGDLKSVRVTVNPKEVRLIS